MSEVPTPRAIRTPTDIVQLVIENLYAGAAAKIPLTPEAQHEVADGMVKLLAHVHGLTAAGYAVWLPGEPKPRLIYTVESAARTALLRWSGAYRTAKVVPLQGEAP